ncbi:unnamed protein product [Urochloa humidicola]
MRVYLVRFHCLRKGGGNISEYGARQDRACCCLGRRRGSTSGEWRSSYRPSHKTVANRQQQLASSIGDGNRMIGREEEPSAMVIHVGASVFSLGKEMKEWEKKKY